VDWQRLGQVIGAGTAVTPATPVTPVAPVAGGQAPGSRGAPPVAATGGVTGLSHCFYNATGATVRKHQFRDDMFSVSKFQSVRTVVAPVTPVTPVTTVADDLIVASDCLAAVPAALPDEWKDGMRRFAEMPTLPGFSRTVWRQAVIDGHQFLHENGTAAFVMGWSLEDLFGLHPECPAVRTDAMGLAFLMRGRRILRLGEFAATIELPRGGETVYRRGSTGAVVAWSWRVAS
jgi:hypothetical protein